MIVLNLQDDLHQMFLEETKEQLDQLEQSLLQLESDMYNEEIVKTIFRAAHSIKGSSGVMGIEPITKLAHHMENVFSMIRSNELTPTEKIITVCLRGLDMIRMILASLCEDSELDIDITPCITDLNQFAQQKNTKSQIDAPATPSSHDLGQISLALTQEELFLCRNLELRGELYKESDLRSNIYKIVVELKQDALMKSIKAFLILNNLKQIGSILKQEPDDLDLIIDETFDNFIVVLLDSHQKEEIIYSTIDSVSEIKEIRIQMIHESKYKAENSTEALENKTKPEERATIRVDVHKIDTLVNLAGEFIIDKETLNQLGRDLKAKYKNDPLIHQFLDLLPHINQVGADLQETIMSTRMLPLENTFNRFPRLVRDLAHRLHKEANFVMEGKETEIDRGMIEELVDPLTHLIRNCLDHGLETPEDRKLSGKDPKGTIVLSAKQEENTVVITLSDDGRGIDVEKVKAKLLSNNLISHEQLLALSDPEILQYIFEPGFSTASQISEVSGRGVGLDVVKANIGKLHGIVDLKTQKGEGTTFTIKLPLTLAIAQALLIQEDEYKFAVPISSVIEIIRLKDDEISEYIHTAKGIEIFNWREQFIPVIRLGKYFGIDPTTHTHKAFIVIVGHSDKKYALIVDKLLNGQEIVIKSLGTFIGEDKMLGNIHGISGVSILGNGSLVYVLDIGAVRVYKHRL